MIPYVTTLRVYNEKDKKQLLDLKKEFGNSSLSKCVIQMIGEYHHIKKKLEKIQGILNKSLKIKYEISKEDYDAFF